MNHQRATGAARTRRTHRVLTALLGCALVAASGSALATPAVPELGAMDEQVVDCRSIGTIPSRAEGKRVRRIRVNGLSVSVLLPRGYLSSDRRYPVLYLLHGGTDDVDHFLVNTEVMRVTRRLKPRQRFIVVTPFGGYAGFYLDWLDGSHDFETRHIQQVLPAIDARFRTQPRRSSRAVAGASMGGFGAMHYALTYPDLFSSVATFSGSLDLQLPDSTAVITVATTVQRECVDGADPGEYQPFGLLVDPVLDASNWSAVNPRARAATAGDAGLRIALSDTTGLPCNEADASDPAAIAIEQATHRGTSSMHEALLSAGVEHSYRTLTCGVHTTPYFNVQVKRHLRELGRHFGHRENVAR